MTFVKGQSGNPGGRPKTKPLSDLLLKELSKKSPGTKYRQAELAVWKLVQLGMAGDVAALKEIFNRIEGRPVQPLEHSGPDGGALTFTLALDRPSGVGVDDGDR